MQCYLKLAPLLVLFGCAQDPPSHSGLWSEAGDGNGGAGGGESTGGGGPLNAPFGQGGQDGQGEGGGAVDPDPDPDPDPVACDYRAEYGVIVIEAEDLSLVDDWESLSDEDGHTGNGYLSWSGASHNATPGNGVIRVDLHFPDAGRYRVQWRTQVGQGTEATEHNDTWMRFADAEDFYGVKTQNNGESRRYPKPACDDGDLMDAMLLLPDVTSAACPNGASDEGWLKVFAAGATDWKWSTLTSDGDGHEVTIEVQAGVYTMELSARAPHHFIDRIVIHEESVDDATARDLTLSATPCP